MFGQKEIQLVRNQQRQSSTDLVKFIKTMYAHVLTNN